MKEFRVLVLDDDPARQLTLRSCCIGAEFFSAWDAKQAIELLEKYEFTQIFLDHDIATEHYLEGYENPDNPVGKYDDETGYAVAKWLSEHPDKSPSASIVVHIQNDAGGARMLKLLVDAGRDVRFIPYIHLVKLIKKI